MASPGGLEELLMVPNMSLAPFACLDLLGSVWCGRLGMKAEGQGCCRGLGC